MDWFYTLGNDWRDIDVATIPETTSKERRRSRQSENRDRVLGFVLLHRAKLDELVKRSRSATMLKKNLVSNFPEQSVHDFGLRIFLQHPKELWRYLNSDRYNGDPIELASAMAGVPEGMSARRSLDYFLAKRNLRNHRGVHFAAMHEREDRILSSKARPRSDQRGRWSSSSTTCPLR
jgi:hypothetical protein